MEREDDEGIVERRNLGESDAENHKHYVHLTLVSSARIDDAGSFGKLYSAKWLEFLMLFGVSVRARRRSGLSLPAAALADEPLDGVDEGVQAPVGFAPAAINDPHGFGLRSLVDAERAGALRVDLGQVLETVAAPGLELVDDAVDHTDALHELYKATGRR